MASPCSSSSQPPSADAADHGGGLALLFAIFDSDKFKKQIAVAELGGFAVSALSDRTIRPGSSEKGLNVPFYERYVKWVGGILTGDLGKSYQKNEPVGRLLVPSVSTTPASSRSGCSR